MEALDATSLPPGFGFHPTDVELISHYLKRKILGYKTELEVIPVVDIYKHEPWDLPAKTRIPSRECKWHFFNTRDRKYPNSSRTNRATEAGYWKSTGKDRMIRSRNRVIGTKKTLVFHEGRPPCGKRTDWIMHEYYLNESECKAVAAGAKELFVLCRVTKRDGMGSRDEEVCAQIEDLTPSCQKNFRRAAEYTSDLKEQNLEMSSPEDLNIEAWVDELYDPDFCAVPAATGCKIELEEVVPSSFAPINQLLPLNVGNSLVIERDEQYCSQELDASLFKDLHYWSDLQENNNIVWGHMDDDIVDYSTPRSNLISGNEVGFTGCIKNEEVISEIDTGVNGCLSDNSKTGIFIRQREIRTFESVPNQRIKMQVHKMESKNPVALNHTVMLNNNDHHLDMNEPPQPVVTNKSAASNNQDTTRIKKEIILEEPPTEMYENYTSKSNQPEVHGASSRRFRSSIKGLVRRVFKEAHMLTRRYSPIGMNCMFLGTCLTGAAALTGYVLHENA